MDKVFWDQVNALRALSDPEFQGRLKVLQEKEEAHLSALGGKAKLVEIEKNHANSKKILQDANHERENAEQDAENIVTQAQSTAKKILDDAESERTRFQTWATSETDRLTALKAEAVQTMNASLQAKKEASELMAVAQKLMSDATGLRDRLNSRVEELSKAGVKVL